MTNSDKISTLEKLTSALDERVDNLEKEVEGITQRSREVETLVHDVDKRLALVADRIERLQKNLDELRTKRWEIWKIIVTAVLSSAMGLAAGRLLR